MNTTAKIEPEGYRPTRTPDQVDELAKLAVINTSEAAPLSDEPTIKPTREQVAHEYAERKRRLVIMLGVAAGVLLLNGLLVSLLV